jgi:magnesium-transporting ATPase (P-type)
MFDFESEFSRMSVLIRDNETNQYIAFCKGSPEKISELSLI